MHGFANEMLIKCWLYEEEREMFYFRGSMACFAYPEKPSLAIKK